LLQDAVVGATLDLKKHGASGIVIVKAHPKFEPVAVAILRRPVRVELVGIKVNAVHRVGEIRPFAGVFVWVEIAPHKVAHP